MRAGTQTLIQALQAIPWQEDPDNDDEGTHLGPSSAPESDSDEEDGLSEFKTMAYAIGQRTFY
jgi:sterol 3beta-glucosyltransferase